MEPNETFARAYPRERLLNKLGTPQDSAFLNGRNPEDIAALETIQVLKAFVGFPTLRTLTGPVTLLRGIDTSPPILQGARNPFDGWCSPEKILLELFAPFGRIQIPIRLQQSQLLGNYLRVLGRKPGPFLGGCCGIAVFFSLFLLYLLNHIRVPLGLA